MNFSSLQKEKNQNDLKRVQDTFLSKLVLKLQGKENKWLTEEVMQFISIYGIFFTQFPKFTYIWVSGYEGKPFKFPRHCLDYYLLIEVCRQVAEVD